MAWPEVTPRVVLGPMFDEEKPPVDPFEDDTPLVCGVDEVETCESCQ